MKTRKNFCTKVSMDLWKSSRKRLRFPKKAADEIMLGGSPCFYVAREVCFTFF